MDCGATLYEEYRVTGRSADIMNGKVSIINLNTCIVFESGESYGALFSLATGSRNTWGASLESSRIKLPNVAPSQNSHIKLSSEAL